MQERGLVLARGPLTDQDDERFRGFSIWSVDQATTRKHAEADPAVRAGRLAVQVMTWMMPTGNLHFTKVHPQDPPPKPPPTNSPAPGPPSTHPQVRRRRSLRRLTAPAPGLPSTLAHRYGGADESAD
jgi:hypothetical protein